MEHKYQSQIKCPYCDYEDKDSWEFEGENGEEVQKTCGSCDREFNVTRDIEVTYSTTRISCKEGEHTYKLDHHFVKKQKWENKIWIKLPESEWTYNRIEICQECGDKEYISLSKEEYEKEINLITT